MSLTNRVRRILGPRGVERTRSLAAGPRRVARRALDSPGGQAYGETVSRLDDHIRATGEGISQITSRLDGLESLAEEVADLQGRLDRCGAQAEDLRLVQLTTVARLEDLKRSEEALEARLDELVRRVDDSNAATAAIDDRVADLTGRLDAVAADIAMLVSELHAPPFTAAPDLLTVTLNDGTTVAGFDERSELNRAGYRSFEDVMRGSEAMVRSRQRPYLKWVEPGQRAIDLGCGRGEMLELLRDHGVDALGVDTDDAMIERCKAKGLDVLQAEALEWLGDQPDESADLIFSAQFVEHLPVSRLPALFVQARRLLRPGGRFIVETVNPHSVPALRTFWVDPTHHHPLFPETVLLLLHQAGFAAAHVEYPCFEGPGDPRTGAGEYAVIAAAGPSAAGPRPDPSGRAG